MHCSEPIVEVMISQSKYIFFTNPAREQKRSEPFKQIVGRRLAASPFFSWKGPKSAESADSFELYLSAESAKSVDNFTFLN